MERNMTTSFDLMDIILLLLSASFGGWALVVKFNADKILSELKEMNISITALRKDFQDEKVTNERRITSIETRMNLRNWDMS